MSLTSYRAAPPRVTMRAFVCGPVELFVVHFDGVDLDGGLLHPASRCFGFGVFRWGAGRAVPAAWMVCVTNAKRALWGPLCGRFALTCEWVFHAILRVGFNAWRRPTLPTLER